MKLSRSGFATALTITVAYIAAGVSWIILSDRVVVDEYLRAPGYGVHVMQRLKGITYVLVTGGMLYLLVRWLLQRQYAEVVARRESDHRLRRLLDSNMLGIFFWNRDGTITEANDYLLDMLGYSREDLNEGRIQWNRITPPEYAHLDQAGLEEIRKTGTCQPFEKVYLHKDGRPVPIFIGGAATGDSSEAGVSFVVNISKQKQVEERLRAKEQEFRDALDSLPNVFLIYDTERRIHFANSRFLARVSRPADQVFGRPHSEFLAPDELKAYNPILDQVFADAKVQSGEFKFQQGETTRIAKVTFVPVLGAGDEVTQVMALESDITEQQETERALLENQRELRQIIDLVPHFIFAKDIEGRFVLANQAVAEAYGTTVDALIGSTDADLNGSDAEVEHFRHDDLQVIQEGHPKHIPREVITDAQGKERVLETIKIPFNRHGEKLPAALGVSTDITERTRAEEALRQSEKRFRTLVENAVDAFFLHDRSGRIVDVNQRACDSLGYSREELLGLKILDIEMNYSRGGVPDLWQHMRLGHPETFDGVHRRRDGTTFPVEVRINMVEVADEVLLLAVARDMTQRYRTDLEVSALGQLGLALSRVDTVEDIATALLDVADLLWQWDAAFVAVRRSGESRYRQVMAIDVVDGRREKFPPRDYEVMPGSMKALIHRGKPQLILRTYENEDIGLPTYGDTGKRCMALMYVPVRLGEEPVALLSLQSYQPRAYSDADLELLIRIANMTAPAIERVRAEARAGAYVALGEQLASVNTPNEVAQIILELAERLISWDAASVSLYDEEKDLVYSVLQMDEVGGRRQAVEPIRHQTHPAGNMRKTLVEGPQLILRSPGEVPKDTELFGDTARRSASILWTPIRSGTRVTGLLSVQSYTFGAYDHRDLEELQALANHCGSALDRARAQNAMRESEELYRRAIQGAGAVPYQMDYATMSYSFVGEDIERITGYPASEFTGDLMRSLVQQVDNKSNPDMQVKTTDARSHRWKEWRADVRLRTRSGEERWVSDYAVQVADELGNPKGSLGILVDITDRKLSEEALKRSEELYRKAITEADAVPYQLDYATNTFTFIGEGIERISGYKADGFTTDNWHEIVQEVIMRGEAAGMTVPEAVRAARSGAIQQWQADLRIRSRNGETRWLADSSIQIRNSSGEATASLGILHDITARKRTEDALRESEQRYALAAQGANDGLWDWDLRSDRIFYSARWKEMVGCSADEVGDQPSEWFERIHPEDQERVKLEIESHIIGTSGHLESEHRILHCDGHWIWMLCRGLAVRDQTGKAVRLAGSFTDISDTREAQERLLHDALHDGLTGLPNRSLLLDRLGRSLERSRRKVEYQFAVLFLDLDRFKNINDSLGHMMGDQVLTTVASRLITCLRPGDTVARFAGDEFAMLLDDITDTKDVRAVTERVLVAINEPIQLEGHEVTVTSSIGVAMGHANYVSPDEVLRDADTALYRAKARGKSRFEIFNPSMHAHVVEALALENDFRRALDREELELYYQPIISMETGRISGVEALLRWQKDGSFISPERFIPLAEETGLIVPLGNWVLRQVARQVSQWTNFPDLIVTINISPRQFVEPDLDSSILAIFGQARVEPRRIGLEITETALMASPDDAARVLQQLHHAGFRLYLDDFGTGYSSLSYLHRFPIDVVKIDRSFVMRMSDTGREREIVESIMLLASTLKMKVTAEGVETQQQYNIIKALGCNAAQGYWFAKPLPPAEIGDLLARTPSW